jgi:hypothetical protein
MRLGEATLNGAYRIVQFHGVGRRYLRNQSFNKLTTACGYAKELAEALNANKSPRAPKVRIMVLRVIGVFDGKA